MRVTQRIPTRHIRKFSLGKEASMFCSECGARVAGKFCALCGFRLGPADPADADVPVIQIVEDWSNLIDFERLVAIPAVRTRIAQSAAQSKKRMTGEDFLDFCDKALGKLYGVPIPLTSIAHFAQSLHARLGIKTGKARSQFFPAAPGEALVALLCSLARHGRTLRTAQQATDGCVLTAALPSDLFALEGDLIVSVARHGVGAQVDAHTDIKGQLIDWGKSTRCLDSLFAELSDELHGAQRRVS